MNEPKQNSPSRRRNDFILIAVLLLCAAAGAVYLFLFRGSGDTVRVTVDGEHFGTYSLSEPRTVEIPSEDGGLNRLIIRDGKAQMEYATCPDGICVAHPPIFRDGESIVCLPNRVAVTAITEGEDDGPDIAA